MFGLDDQLASFSDGSSLVIVLAVAVLLGLRHATDPDHLAAVTTLLATKGSRACDAARLGAAWGLGHAVTLFAFGLPIVLYGAFLPDPVQRGAETAVGVLIVGLAVWLLYRWRRGQFHVHEHEHERAESLHRHLHSHEHGTAHGHPHGAARSPLQAFGIGLLHGMGGSAGVGILLISTIDGRAVAVVALSILALFTATSMTMLTTGFGLTLSSGPIARSYGRVAPALGLASLAFGVWYALGAQEVLPYYF